MQWKEDNETYFLDLRATTRIFARLVRRANSSADFSNGMLFFLTLCSVLCLMFGFQYITIHKVQLPAESSNSPLPLKNINPEFRFLKVIYLIVKISHMMSK